MSTKANNNTSLHYFDDWTFDFSKNALTHSLNKSTKRLEPKVSQLLHTLIAAEGQVVSREELLDLLWKGVVVGDDTLARTVSRLRAALNDSASSPQFIETIPKKGYRFKAQLIEQPTEKSNRSDMRYFVISIMVLISVLSLGIGIWRFMLSTNKETVEALARADGLYMAFEEQKNEAALALYENVLENEPQNAKAQSGIANAMVQRLVRWPTENYPEVSDISLTSALSTGQLATPDAKLMLERARLIAEKAVRTHPNSSDTLKSLGLVYSAEGKINQAIQQYQKAIALNDSAWRSMVNLGELYTLSDQHQKALITFVQAFNTMQEQYAEEPQNIGPWQPALGNIIAQRYLDNGDYEQVQYWTKRILDIVPFEPTASTLLITSLLSNQQLTEAQQLCDSYASKLEPLEVCSDFKPLSETSH